jgi:purine-nucleoside/S-methyl-5'-thioadenosine phosphorylase / adenosine deaminase
MTGNLSIIQPDWPAPSQISAFTTTRYGGVSQPPYDSLNLGLHVGDDPIAVNTNRKRLRKAASLPSEPLWLEQVHGTEVITANNWRPGIEADAIYSQRTNQVCAVMTADCLPVLFTDITGTQVAATHAGWRGLLNGILETTVSQFSGQPGEIMAWLGPAIGPQQFEVGTDVFGAFLSKSPQAEEAFKPVGEAHYLADIYQLARQRLKKLGINAIYGGQHCTVSENERFFSYRRDRNTGRMASLIWIAGK